MARESAVASSRHPNALAGPTAAGSTAASAPLDVRAMRHSPGPLNRSRFRACVLLDAYDAHAFSSNRAILPVLEKLTDVVGLYLNRREHALVLCVDEKTQIQALDGPSPDSR